MRSRSLASIMVTLVFADAAEISQEISVSHIVNAAALQALFADRARDESAHAHDPATQDELGRTLDCPAGLKARQKMSRASGRGQEPDKRLGAGVATGGRRSSSESVHPQARSLSSMTGAPSLSNGSRAPMQSRAWFFQRPRASSRASAALSRRSPGRCPRDLPG